MKKLLKKICKKKVYRNHPVMDACDSRKRYYLVEYKIFGVIITRTYEPILQG